MCSVSGAKTLPLWHTQSREEHAHRSTLAAPSRLARTRGDHTQSWCCRAAWGPALGDKSWPGRSLPAAATFPARSDPTQPNTLCSARPALLLGAPHKSGSGASSGAEATGPCWARPPQLLLTGPACLSWQQHEPRAHFQLLPLPCDYLRQAFTH